MRIHVLQLRQKRRHVVQGKRAGPRLMQLLTSSDVRSGQRLMRGARTAWLAASHNIPYRTIAMNVLNNEYRNN